MINTVEPPPRIPWFSIRLGTHNSTIRCATTVTPQCGRGRLREMVVYEKYQRGFARSHARANLVSRALFPGFGGGAGIANWRHCFEGLQHYFNIATSLHCRRILGGRNLVRVRNVVVAAIFDFMTVELLGGVSTWRFREQIARSKKTPALQATLQHYVALKIVVANRPV